MQNFFNREKKEIYSKLGSKDFPEPIAFGWRINLLTAYIFKDVSNNISSGKDPVLLHSKDELGKLPKNLKIAYLTLTQYLASAISSLKEELAKVTANSKKALGFQNQIDVLTRYNNCLADMLKKYK